MGGSIRRNGWKVGAVFLGALAVGAVVSVAEGPNGPGAQADERNLVIAGGGTSGVYYHYADALAAVSVDQLGVRAAVAETGGSVENLEMVADGEAVMGFSAADAAADAVGGQAGFEEPLPIEAVARVYDDFVHLVVAEGSDIESVSDITGRQVSLGAPGSGTAVIAFRLLATAEVGLDEVDDARLGIDDSIQAFRDGEIEAFFWSGGLTTPGLHTLADDVPIDLVPLGDLVDHVSERYGHVYRHAIIPRGTYGVEEDVAAMAVPNYLVTHADEDPALIHDLLDVAFSERADLSRRVTAVGQLDRRRAIFTEPVDLHPGALQYYREAKP